LKSLARGYTDIAIKTVGGLAINAESESVRLEANRLLLERGWGRAPQPHTGEHGEGEIRITVRHITEGKKAPQK
jgi:hypothetical protein